MSWLVVILAFLVMTFVGGGVILEFSKGGTGLDGANTVGTSTSTPTITMRHTGHLTRTRGEA